MSFINNPPTRSAAVLDPGGQSMSIWWYGWFTKLAKSLNGSIGAGVSTTVTLAKLTNTGTAGSITFVNGIATAVVAPT